MRRIAGWARGVAALVGCVAAGAAVAQTGTLNDEVQRAVNASKLGTARVGISIYETTTDTALASYNSGQGFIPASNMKILTSGAAMFTLGSDFVFRTELVVRDGVLVVRGSGDPALADPDVLSEMESKLSVKDVLGLLAEAAKKAGVESVREVVVDDRVFDREFIHPAWPARNFNQPHSAQISGVNFHANVLSFYLRPNPDGPGSAPLVSTQPEAPWLTIINRARTVAGSNDNTASPSREMGTNKITLTGDVRRAYAVPSDVTLDNNGLFFGKVLARELILRGIKVGSDSANDPVSVRLAEADESLDGGRVVAVVTTPMSVVLKRCNADSSNLYAEALLKRMGNAVTNQPGSWENGRSVLRMVIAEKLGPQAAAGCVISDGSGISRENSVTPALLTRWLDLMADDDEKRDAFISSLAAPGNGTLRSRFRDARLYGSLHAKSGFINGVRSLSGYVIEPDGGKRVAFSVIVNNISTGDQDAAAREIHESVVRIIDTWLRTCRKADALQGG